MIGKRILDDLYVHLRYASLSLPPECQARVQAALLHVRSEGLTPNVVKWNQRSGRISLLSYPTFEDEAFPELAASWVCIEGQEEPTSFRTYTQSLNRPILHRKELLVGPDHESRAEWVRLTREAEEIGLFEDPAAIGFRLNWERLIQSKGYELIDDRFLPLGNEEGPDESLEPLVRGKEVQRHLTALSRVALSAPVQLLIRHGQLQPGVEFFDYGCGRGDDKTALANEGYRVAGWDPHYAPNEVKSMAEVVNLGFVINVIEDPAERVEALVKAFSLTKGVLAVSVMLHGSSSGGVPFKDGVLTSRQTFQKYFSQSELKDYVEEVLHRPAHMVGPGVAFVFASEDWEQRFSAGRYRTQGVARRLLLSRAIQHRPARQPRVKETRPPRLSRSEARYLALKPFLDEFWRIALELGRWPDAEELGSRWEFPAECASTAAAIRLIEQHYDTSLLRAAALTRTDDLSVYFAARQFEKRKAFTQLEPRLRKDIKTFFGDYRSAQLMGLQLLQNTADRDQLLVACQKASEEGLGWLDGEHSLQLHIDLVERLPAVLRAYVSCGLILWDSLGEVTLVKIHIGSGKLSLLEFDEFDQSPLPALKKRVKINLRKLDYDVFEYGSIQYPKPLLFWKSRYMHEDQPGYAEQRCFDDDLEASGAVSAQAPNPAQEELVQELALRRLMIKGHKLVRCTTIPDLDQPCGANFTYRSLIECGETQRQLGISNLPLQPQTYNALYDLASNVLDPLIEYFGAIKLTYGFCSAELGKHITSRVAHHLDQHAGHELGASKKLICSRGGAACDFLVADEDMGEVADWIIMNLPFDRLYFYGPSRPIHISYSSREERKPYAMVPLANGRLMPRRYAKQEPSGQR